MIKSGRNKDEHRKFAAYQVSPLPSHIMEMKLVAEQSCEIGKIQSYDGSLSYNILSCFILSLLGIPHSNTSCDLLYAEFTMYSTQQYFM
jgi:hypothetical protein